MNSKDIIIKLIDNHVITGEEAYTLIRDVVTNPVQISNIPDITYNWKDYTSSDDKDTFVYPSISTHPNFGVYEDFSKSDFNKK